jgi:hypothetical protein
VATFRWHIASPRRRDARVAEMDAEVVAAAIVEDAVRSALEK